MRYICRWWYPGADWFDNECASDQIRKHQIRTSEAATDLFGTGFAKTGKMGVRAWYYIINVYD